jgi:trk system potassium uptake protein
MPELDDPARRNDRQRRAARALVSGRAARAWRRRDLGLGRFGQTVARELTFLGHDVLALDTNERIVQAIADDVTRAIQTDFTDEDALDELGLDKIDTAIVAVSSNIEASILTTVLLQRLGVRRIVAEAGNELHGSILERLGVSRVVFPEREMGLRVAHSFAAAGVLDYFDVAPGYGFARVPVTEPLAGRTLGALDLPHTYGVTPISLLRSGTVTLNPGDSEVLREADELIVAGLDEDLERLPGRDVARTR